MNRLAKYRQQLGQDNSGINYSTLTNLLKKIHDEIDPKIKQMENFMNHGLRESLYYPSLIESVNCDPCRWGMASARNP